MWLPHRLVAMRGRTLPADCQCQPGAVPPEGITRSKSGFMSACTAIYPEDKRTKVFLWYSTEDGAWHGIVDDVKSTEE